MSLSFGITTNFSLLKRGVFCLLFLNAACQPEETPTVALGAAIVQAQERLLNKEIQLLDSLALLEKRIQAAELSAAQIRELRRYLRIFVQLEDRMETSPLSDTLRWLVEQQPFAEQWQRFQMSWNEQADCQAWLAQISTTDGSGLLLADTSSPFIQELAFYQWDPAGTFADIGAGDGLFAYRMGLLYPQTIWTVTELVPILVASLRQRALWYNKLMRAEQFRVVQGGVECANLPAATFDAIILRQTLHHFSEPEAMLASIKSALRPNGVLLVHEGLRNVGGIAVHCELAYSEEAFRALLARAGWRINRTLTLATGSTLYELIPN